MEKSATLHSNQIVLIGRIPFSVTVPGPSADIDVAQMTETQLHARLQRGYDDYKEGRTHNTEKAFAKFREVDGNSGEVKDGKRY